MSVVVFVGGLVVLLLLLGVVLVGLVLLTLVPIAVVGCCDCTGVCFLFEVEVEMVLELLQLRLGLEKQPCGRSPVSLLLLFISFTPVDVVVAVVVVLND